MKPRDCGAISVNSSSILSEPTVRTSPEKSSSQDIRAMSPVVPDAGGFVVISQVRPQNDQGNGPEEGQSYKAPAGMTKAVAAFYRGEPEVLGTTQIFTGILLICFFIIIMISNERTAYFLEIITYSGILTWAGILYIIAGSLSVAASVKPTAGKVTSSLVMNVFTSLASASGIIMAASEFSMLGRHYGPYRHMETYCAYYNNDTTQCLGAFNLAPLYTGILSLILLLFTLMFCISISTSVFACKTVCRTSFEEVSVVIYQTTSVNASDTTRDVPPDSTAALT